MDGVARSIVDVIGSMVNGIFVSDFPPRVNQNVLKPEVRKVADHRLVGHYLLRTPVSCSGSWASELRVGLPAGEKRTQSP